MPSCPTHQVPTLIASSQMPPCSCPRVIDYFRGYWAPLSNFSSSTVIYNAITYPTAEHAFQAAKTTDLGARGLIRCAATPKLAKSMGRGVKLRPDWESVKLDIMYQILESKFTHPALSSVLLASRDTTLVEGNTNHDNFWGDCRCPKHIGTPGENHLGRLLMLVRDTLVA